MWSGRSSFTSLVVGVFVVYVVHTCWVMYGIVYTRPCASDGNCIQPYLARRPKLQVSAGSGWLRDPKAGGGFLLSRTPQRARPRILQVVPARGHGGPGARESCRRCPLPLVSPLKAPRPCPVVVSHPA